MPRQPTALAYKLTAVLLGWGNFSDASLTKKLILVLVWWKRDSDLENAGVSPLESANSGVGLLGEKKERWCWKIFLACRLKIE